MNGKFCLARTVRHGAGTAEPGQDRVFAATCQVHDNSDTFRENLRVISSNGIKETTAQNCYCSTGEVCASLRNKSEKSPLGTKYFKKLYLFPEDCKTA